MELICAIDLKSGMVVHGKAGRRSEYAPLDWGLAKSAEPREYISSIRPKSVYIADLDRIEGRGSHDALVLGLGDLISRCYLDRGCRGPDDMLDAPFIENVVGTETAGSNLSSFPGRYLSVDIREGCVVPGGEDPTAILARAEEWGFAGCIYLNITAVGGRAGITPETACEIRSTTDLPLIYGGGVRDTRDLEMLADAGYDGAILATAIHTGGVEPDHVRRGRFC